MNEIILGIDISKKTFDVALLIDEKVKSKKFNNSKPGFKKLLAWINNKEIKLTHACMEATGIYGQELSEFLYANDIPVSVVNPARIKGFAQCELARSKTDMIDAQLIARFCKLMKPGLWHPKADHIKTLQQWTKRFDDLQAMYRQEANRLEVSAPCLHSSIKKSMDFLTKKMQEAKKIIKNNIDSDKNLKEQQQLLLSIPGIGEKTAATILSIIDDINKFNSAKAVAAFAGLSPKQKQSGTSVKGKTRLSKTGNCDLRKALYMPAMVAIRYNPIIKDFCTRLEKSGKCKMSIIGAVMRKLLHMIYGILKTGKEFDATILKHA